MTLRYRIATGPDTITAETIKADMETTSNMLHCLFRNTWKRKEIRAQWKEGIGIKLPKKGDLQSCNNYRGITILSVPSRVINGIQLENIRQSVNPSFGTNRSASAKIDYAWARSPAFTD